MSTVANRVICRCLNDKESKQET